MRKGLGCLLTLLALGRPWNAAGDKTAPSLFIQGVDLYNAGRYSEATEVFENAVKRHEHEKESQDYIERIRKETVERIRNKALTGVSKNMWQSKYYFMNESAGRVRVGVSVQEVFDRESLNFRPGAVDALMQLAGALQRSDSARVDLELVNEVTQETPPNPEILSQQLTALYSLLSLAAQNNFPK